MNNKLFVLCVGVFFYNISYMAKRFIQSWATQSINCLLESNLCCKLFRARSSRLQIWRKLIGSLRNYDSDGNAGQRERLKHNRFYEKNNNSAYAARFPAQLRREMTKFLVDLRTGTTRRSILLSLPDLNWDAVPSLQFQPSFPNTFISNRVTWY